MIWDSYYWKIELRETTDYIISLSKEVDAPRDKNDYLMERSLMVGFYNIRKLVEAMKVTSRCARTKVQIVAHHSRFGNDYIVNHMNWQMINDFYELENRVETSVKLITICNILIHSFIFYPVYNESRHTIAILFTSDRTEYKNLYNITIRQVSGLFRRVANDYPSNAYMVKSEQVTDELRKHFKDNGITPIEQDGILYAYE